ncbi:MAG TPA: hypothetical protein VEI97_08155 [bacterium]|nr:hypothetical protein [bacterium]
MTFRNVLVPVAALVVGAAVGWRVADRPPQPMPAPTPLAPNTPQPDTLRAARVEVVGPDGKVAVVLTSENGVPVAIVSDRGTARRIDLAAIARRFN